MIQRLMIYLMLFFAANRLGAEPVRVRHIQGTTHGFLKLQTLEGKPLAVGDLVVTPHGNLVTSRLTFKFRDGSLDDETTVFSQRGVFRLVSDRHIQRGPFFPKDTEMTFDASGHVTSHTVERDGKEKRTDEHMDLPLDIANGLQLTLVTNLREQDPETPVSMLLMSSKPTLVKIVFRPDGKEGFTVGGAVRQATRFSVKVELGGIKGVIAPVIGKEPKLFHLWFLDGSAPVFLRAEGQIFEDGPVVRIQQISASFASSNNSRTGR